MGDLVINDIIPAVGALRRRFPFTLPTMFDQQAQGVYDIQPGPLNCQDMLASDALFDSIYYEYV